MNGYILKESMYNFINKIGAVSYEQIQLMYGNVYDKDTIKKWLRLFYWRFFSQQFKRSCIPDGPKVGSVALSPRGDWRMPSDANVQIWLDEVEKI